MNKFAITRRQLALSLLLWTIVFALAWSFRPVAAQPPARGRAVLCTVINSTATTLTAFTQADCLATPGEALYITDITASATTIATTTVDQYLTLKFGTGTNCGTGTTVIWAAYNLAFAGVATTFVTPVRVPQNVDLCWIDNVAGNKTFIVSAFKGQ